MRATWLLPLCLLLPACASAKAGLTSEDVYAREGAYISAAGIYGIEAFPTPAPYRDADNSKGGAGLRIGYRGDNDTAIELFVEDVRGFNLDSDTDPGTKIELRNLGVAGKLYLTGGRFQPYVLLGAGWSMAIYSEHAPFASDAFFWRAGLGADFYISDNLVFFVEGNYNNMQPRPVDNSDEINFGHDTDFDSVQAVAGFTWRF